MGISTEPEIDTFFRYLLKAKFANTQSEGKRFDDDYHREMFKNDINNILQLKHNPSEVKKFLENTFTYYTQLYTKIWKSYSNYGNGFDHVFFNKLNEMDGQFLLILSSCKLNDAEEDEKIEKISYELDRFFALHQLQNAYESNVFNQTLYKISSEIRDGTLDNIRGTFDKYLLEQLSKQRNSEAKEPIQYAFFRNTGINLNMRFKRYFFARIEKFIAENTNLNMKHPFENLVTKTGPKNGFHIEHILSRNEENLKLFNEDEDTFEQERNRLGGILLLKGKDNISSGNESYLQKLKSYNNTLYWNETLREDFYKSKLDIRNFKNKYSLDEMIPLSTKFGPDELESRQRLLFKMIKIIWN
ncbi:HNH endonuclease family protein [Methanohalophilus portucalensis]